MVNMMVGCHWELAFSSKHHCTAKHTVLSDSRAGDMFLNLFLIHIFSDSWEVYIVFRKIPVQ